MSPTDGREAVKKLHRNLDCSNLNFSGIATMSAASLAVHMSLVPETVETFSPEMFTFYGKSSSPVNATLYPSTSLPDDNITK